MKQENHTIRKNAFSGISVVVPVYNSENTLEVLVDRLESVLIASTLPFELVMVDDGSSDGSWSVLEGLSEGRKWLRAVRLMRNFGQHNALLCGVRCARYSITATIDDDLQNPPEELPKLIEKLGEGNDLVYGTPFRRSHNLCRDLFSYLLRISLWPLIGRNNSKIVTSFRVFRTDLRNAFEQYNGPYVSLDVLLGWGARKVSSIEVTHDPRASGRSNYSIFGLVSHAITMVTGFSTLPLRLASFIGLSSIVLGIAIMAFVLISYVIQGGSMPGFPFLVCTIIVFSGAQLFAIGIIGEYIGKLYFRTMNMPTYVIQEES